MIAISLSFLPADVSRARPLVHAEIRLIHAHLQQAKRNAHGPYKTIEVLKYRKQAEVANSSRAVSLHDQLF